MDDMIREYLFQAADEKYRDFHRRLCPGVENNLGVRLPDLRRLAKQLAAGDWRSYLSQTEEEYYEEVMLKGLILGYVKTDIEELLRYLAAFIPKIDNWGVCDSMCNGLKIVKKHRERVWGFLQPYLASGEEFPMRFGVVMLMCYYVDNMYIDRVLAELDRARQDGYYLKMAVAWAISECFIKYPEKTMAYLQRNTLDTFTYNKALQKITESYRVEAGTRELIRGMKRKNGGDSAGQ